MCRTTPPLREPLRVCTTAVDTPCPSLHRCGAGVQVQDDAVARYHLLHVSHLPGDGRLHTDFQRAFRHGAAGHGEDSAVAGGREEGD